MKTPTTATQVRVLCFRFLLGMLSLPAAGVAQSPQGNLGRLRTPAVPNQPMVPGSGPSVYHQNPPQSVKPEAKFDLNFPGGSPTELVKAISDQLAKPLSVIVMPKDKDAVVPAFHVHQVTVRELFLVLSQASRESVVVNNGRQIEHQVVEWSFQCPNDGMPNEDSLWYLFRNLPQKPPAPVAGGTEASGSVSVYNLADLCALNTTDTEELKKRAQVVTEAIMQAWGMGKRATGSVDEGGNGEVKFHEATGLLMVYATAEQTRTASNVLEAIVGGVARSGGPRTAPVDAK